MKATTDNVIHNAVALPPIRLGNRDHDARVARIALILVVFMRIVALLWIAEGVVQWVAVLTDGSALAFAAMSTQRTAAVFFFCVLDFVAAVGLWLATPWGGVVWLVTVGAQVLSLVALPGFWTHGTAVVLSDAVLVPSYLALAWQAGHNDNENG